MKVTSYGPQSKKTGKDTKVILEDDVVQPPVPSKGKPHHITFWVKGKYQNEVVMSAEEIITLLLALPPNIIPEALVEAAGRTNEYGDKIYDVSNIPELLKQLAAGGFAALLSQVSQE